MKNLASSELFSPQDLQTLDPTNIPTHIAIIPDGNRRWAQSKFLSSLQGHIAGADASVLIVQAAKEIGVKAVTIYGFSTENWKRPRPEVEHLMKTIETYLERYQNKLIDSEIRFRAIGNRTQLGTTLQRIIESTEAKTAECCEFDLVLAINYGGRDEISRAVQSILRDKVSPEEVTPELISRYLDTNELPDPDLIIRTSGEMRLSNFLLWQSSYAELYVDTTAWPDFGPRHLLGAVQKYQQRTRRIGGGSV